MKAITVQPKSAGTARLEEVPEPEAREGSVLVEAIAVGVCGTDVEIAEGKYGWAPPGRARLVLGHESLGRVLEPGASLGLRRGDLLVGIVRRPDPAPCPNCAVGEWDMCRNGLYTERGIKELDGFMSQRWRIEPEYAMRIDPSLGLLGFSSAALPGGPGMAVAAADPARTTGRLRPGARTKARRHQSRRPVRRGLVGRDTPPEPL
jgi:glucose 1-dehydrogenase